MQLNTQLKTGLGLGNGSSHDHLIFIFPSCAILHQARANIEGRAAHQVNNGHFKRVKNGRTPSHRKVLGQHAKEQSHLQLPPLRYHTYLRLQGHFHSPTNRKTMPSQFQRNPARSRIHMSDRLGRRSRNRNSWSREDGCLDGHSYHVYLYGQRGRCA